MAVKAVTKDLSTLTMTLIAEFEASPERVWQLFSDRLQMERWWGPPTFPATMTLHDLRPGGRIEYYMTGPAGEQPRGYWEVLEVDEPTTIVAVDGFADPDGNPDLSLPRTQFRVEISPIDEQRTSMRIISFFDSVETMNLLSEMGMEEGLSGAVGQIDDLLVGPSVHELETAGAKVHYYLHSGDEAATPLLIIGSPMAADGFVTLASSFNDRPVITYDPRGVARSQVTDGSTVSTPNEHAEDLHRLIQRVSPMTPVDVFASSGGAVNALALLAAYPGDVRRVVAHEPPLAAVLPDRVSALAAVGDTADAYQRAGLGVGMAKFFALVSHEGEFPEGFGAGPDPDPAMFGLPTEDDGRRDDALLGRNMLTSTGYEVELDALRFAEDKLVLAYGATSGETMASRAPRALAALLGVDAVEFPGDHSGFLGGEYGMTGEPEAFAAKLREVLAQ